MGIIDKITAIEDLASRKCTVTYTANGDPRDGAELYVENCRSVRELSENCIVPEAYRVDIRVVGTELELCNFGVGDLKITGKIHSITFEEREE